MMSVKVFKQYRDELGFPDFKFLVTIDTHIIPNLEECIYINDELYTVTKIIHKFDSNNHFNDIILYVK